MPSRGGHGSGGQLRSQDGPGPGSASGRPRRPQPPLLAVKLAVPTFFGMQFQHDNKSAGCNRLPSFYAGIEGTEAA